MTTNQDATVTDAAIEAAARALWEEYAGHGAGAIADTWEEYVRLGGRTDFWHNKAQTAYDAAAPVIAAQAKADALAEVTEWEEEADASIRCAANLRESTKRADQKEADKYEHHATISRNLAARMRETLEGATPCQETRP